MKRNQYLWSSAYACSKETGFSSPGTWNRFSRPHSSMGGWSSEAGSGRSPEGGVQQIKCELPAWSAAPGEQILEEPKQSLSSVHS